MTRIGKIRTHSHLPEKHDWLKNVIAGRAPAITPLALQIAAAVIRPHLLRMAIKATVGCINLRSSRSHPGRRHRVNIRSLFIRLRIEAPDLKIRHDRHSEPRKGEDSKDPKKERLQPFHQCPPPLSPSRGLRKVGTLAVRPNPSSIRPK